MNKKQDGVVLVISLIMLLVMTLLGVSAMTTSLIEEKMAGNSRDVKLAFQATETGLREAELWIANQTVEPDAKSDGSSRVWTLNVIDPDTTNPDNWWQERNETWWLNNSIAYGTTIPKVNTVPHTVIEYKQFVSDDLLVGNGNSSEGLTYYRVTSRGTGGSDQARVLLQTTTARRF